MRRALCVLIGCLLLLTGCGNSPAPPVTEGFRCAVTLDYDGAVYAGTLTRQTSQNGMLVVTSPPSVEGLSMAWEGETVTLSYGGMALKLDEEKLPVGAAVKVMNRALDSCAEHVGEDGAETVLHGEFAQTAYTMTFDLENGYPCSLVLDAVPLTVTFSGWEPCG